MKKRAVTKGFCYLVVKHEQKSAFYIHIARPFHLETIRLLSGGHSVPLGKKTDKTEQNYLKLQ